MGVLSDLKIIGHGNPDTNLESPYIQGVNKYTVKPVLNGTSRVQNIFPLKPGFRLIKVYYDN
jgi:hypothetical protein